MERLLDNQFALSLSKEADEKLLALLVVRQAHPERNANLLVLSLSKDDLMLFQQPARCLQESETYRRCT